MLRDNEWVDMTNHGETPESEESAPETVEIDFGETLYTDEGVPIGTVRGIEEGGVFVTTRSGVEALSVEHARSGHTFGEAELMWRCMECGEMGRIDGDLPDECPGCDAPREDLM